MPQAQHVSTPLDTNGGDQLNAIRNLCAIIHVKLNRAWRHFPAGVFGPFEFGVSLNLILGEDIAFQEEGMIGLKRFKRLTQAAADGWHLRQFFGRQIIEVLSIASPG